ncbi:unnamed protein product [Rotaria sp. Silwood1]|nr:unnamed protein product [Rotaria sp. Silwood1]CAF3634702.1 unnamed protein product [Rotaria sp. Silwood1]CAF4573498.1 unnamed protein product [Rotaria sp. Silwood1]CAF4613365.1 unnamed protein product [Rotaria sp. Silwood1]CAF4627224.1 unnamed protein product [Rotaria sp. Silwood1]
MIRFSESTLGDLVIEEVYPHFCFQHSFWRILLILLAFISFIIACIFNRLAASDSNSIFTHRTGSISDNNLTEFIPASWTFSIWGIIYCWQAAWLIYAITRIPRKSYINYLYIVPNTLHSSVFIFYIINMILNIGWLFIWDRGYFGWSSLVMFFMFITILVPMIITHVLLQPNRLIYFNSKRKLDIWLVRILVHNGLAIYSTWLYLATLLNVTIWIVHVHNKNFQLITATSTAALALVLVGIIFYFICENFIFYFSMAYTFSPWFVMIFTLFGVLSKNYTRNDIPDRNKFYAFMLFIICCILFIIRLGLFLVRYYRSRIPTIQEP